MPLQPTDQASAAFLGLRLRALDQIVSAQGRDLLAAHDINVPHACVSVLRFVGSRLKTTTTEIVEELLLSRQVIIQRLKLLESLKLIESKTDISDRRSRIIRLTTAGKNEDKKICKVLVHIDAALRLLDEELDAPLSKLLYEAAASLRQRSLTERVRDHASEAPIRNRNLAKRRRAG